MDLSARPGERNDITDVAGFAVGHHQRNGRGWLTGSTVILPPAGTVGAADVRGGGPATRDTDAMGPTTMVEQVDAVCLTGGSAYGLDVAGGVMAWLEEEQRGFAVGPEDHQVVPIVPTAAIFDLGAGGSFANRPDASFGRRAATAAGGRSGRGPVRQGSVGAGTGARAGLLRGGLGSASAVTPAGVTVGALAVVNSAGSVVDPRTGELWGARVGVGGEFASLRRPTRSEVRAFTALAEPISAFNTTLVVVATDAALSKAECHRLCGAAHDGMARAINPVHGYTDGDTAFGLSTGAIDIEAHPESGALTSSVPRISPLGQILEVAADAVSRAIAHAILHAASAGGVASYSEAFPSATRVIRA